MVHDTQNNTARFPVVVVMGHVDHGKSSLLDYIRKSNVTAGEVGGITQHISAYEVNHTTSDGEAGKITFLDTPGHAAFTAVRHRGARVADIAILIVSAEDGVQPQTLEALKTILDAKIPYVVAINKIDRPNANPEKVKMSLSEHGIYAEGWGGDVPVVFISAKTGAGVSDLLDTIVLLSAVQGFKGNTLSPASGIVIESERDPKKGLSATVIIKDGTLRVGDYIVAEDAYSPVRSIIDHTGKNIKEATFSSPVRIVGWNILPPAGAEFVSIENKKQAEEMTNVWAEEKKNQKQKPKQEERTEEEEALPHKHIALIIEADTAGSLDAVRHELAKINFPETVVCEIIDASVGAVTETDIKKALSVEGPIVLAFHTEIDKDAKSLAERSNVPVFSFDIIYKLTEWLDEYAKQIAPKIQTEVVHGEAKIACVFSSVKGNQICGGRVAKGYVSSGDLFRLIRGGEVLCSGKVRELQSQKQRVSDVKEGMEFGAMIDCKTKIDENDRLEIIHVEEK